MFVQDKFRGSVRYIIIEIELNPLTQGESNAQSQDLFSTFGEFLILAVTGEK